MTSERGSRRRAPAAESRPPRSRARHRAGHPGRRRRHGRGAGRRAQTEDVRYIGVDTPESVKPDTPVECYALAASHFNEDLVEGETVRLDFDAERRDVYGRLLAYVYLGDGFVNAELVRRGYATTLTIPPNTATRRCSTACRARPADGRGLWALRTARLTAARPSTRRASRTSPRSRRPRSRVSAISRTPKPTVPRFSVDWISRARERAAARWRSWRAALALERRLLLELDLELVEALAHAQIGRRCLRR